MARGSLAKEQVTEKIKECFGQNYVGIFDKKIYVWADDGGERVQIALTMTCPKGFVGNISENDLSYNTGRDFSNGNTITTAPDQVEISQEERDNIRELMAKMGL